MSAWSLADIQRMREEWEIAHRLDGIAREHRMRQVLGDDVYEMFTITWDPDAFKDGLGGEEDKP